MLRNVRRGLNVHIILSDESFHGVLSAAVNSVYKVEAKTGQQDFGNKTGHTFVSWCFFFFLQIF